MTMISCTKEVDLTGNWKMIINLQEHELPVVIKLKQSQKELEGIIINSSEFIRLTGKIEKNEFELNFETGYAKLVGKVEGQKLIGKWIRTNKEDYQVEFTAQKTNLQNLFENYEKDSTLIDFAGKWKIKFEKDKFGLGQFTQKGSRIQGSILTETGDYRFLDGHVQNNKAYLYGFDGVFSFILEIIIKEKEFLANMYAGKSHQEEIFGKRDEAFTLADPSLMTVKTTDEPFNLKLKDINGQVIDLSQILYKNKVKVIQIFGSWCPNCIDETRFFLRWRKENKDKLGFLNFFAVAFERTNSKEEAIKNLRKLKAKINLDYPILFAAYDKTKKVTDIFPIDKNRAFPTTLYLDRNNKIIKIHTGFAGQATGEFFNNFEKDFNETINLLLK